MDNHHPGVDVVEMLVVPLILKVMPVVTVPVDPNVSVAPVVAVCPVPPLPPWPTSIVETPAANVVVPDFTSPPAPPPAEPLS